MLPDGNYRATLVASGVTTPNGTPLPADYIHNFYFLLGDANHDRQVDLSDFEILAGNFGLPNRVFSEGDFNYDSQVNLNDFNILAGRFGFTVGPQTFGATTIGSAKKSEGILDDLLT